MKKDHIAGRSLVKITINIVCKLKKKIYAFQNKIKIVLSA